MLSYYTCIPLLNFGLGTGENVSLAVRVSSIGERAALGDVLGVKI